MTDAFCCTTKAHGCRKPRQRQELSPKAFTISLCSDPEKRAETKYQGCEKKDPFLDLLFLSVPHPQSLPGWRDQMEETVQRREFGIKCPLSSMPPGSGGETQAPWVLHFLTFVKLSFCELLMTSCFISSQAQFPTHNTSTVSVHVCCTCQDV